MCLLCNVVEPGGGAAEVSKAGELSMVGAADEGQRGRTQRTWRCGEGCWGFFRLKETEGGRGKDCVNESG